VWGVAVGHQREHHGGVREKQDELFNIRGATSTSTKVASAIASPPIRAYLLIPTMSV